MTASGIRVGSPAVTTQGMTEPNMKEVAGLIGRALRQADADLDPARADELRAAVGALVARHPAYARPVAVPR
jgi:glycine hydroxymethyltransferase